MSSLFEEHTPLTAMDNPFRPSPSPTTVFGTRPASLCGIADDNFLASIEKEFAFDDNFFGLPSFGDFAGIDDDDFLADNWDLPDLVSRSNDDERLPSFQVSVDGEMKVVRTNAHRILNHVVVPVHLSPTAQMPKLLTTKRRQALQLTHWND